jgi:hypothetical protein
MDGIHSSVGGHVSVYGQPRAVWQVPVKAPQLVSASAKQENVLMSVPPFNAAVEKLEITFLFKLSSLCFRFFFFMSMCFWFHEN